MLRLQSISSLLLPCWLAFEVAMLATRICAEEPLQFNRDIRPILSDNCFACHGPDQANRQADLRLDRPGEWDAEEFANRILSDDDELRMPPAKSQKTLSASQKELLKRWIAAGARYETHWAFVSPSKLTTGNNIDDFIRSELKKRGLTPSKRADAGTLVRRVALDLTGLPPVYSQGTLTKDNHGRDHHPRCFSVWMAGAGIKPGFVFGETDDFSYNIVKDPVHIHDLNATALHLLGIDHTKLIYRFQGRDYRLTDVHGEVVQKILT